jgi:hypothetical protein
VRLETGLPEQLGDYGRGALLRAAELGVGVQLASQRNELVLVRDEIGSCRVVAHNFRA